MYSLFRDYLALNVYVALCYYKLDYYDVAQEVLQVYLQKYPDSAIAINLKACNHFRLYDGNAAQAEMKQLIEKISSSFSFGHDLIRHNTVVCILLYMFRFFSLFIHSLYRYSEVVKMLCKFYLTWSMLYQKPDLI